MQNTISEVSDRPNYAQCSRFFTDEVIQTMEEIALGREVESEDASIYRGQKGDIAKRIRYMWE